MQINLGLLGAASITPRSIIAPAKKLATVNLYGIAASNIERANHFAEQYNIPHTFKDYNTLLASEEIDAVYIALPNNLHAPWIIAAARANKHILVEKPLCIHKAEIKQINEAIKETGVHLLEGVMTQHHPWENKLKTLVNDKYLGELIEVKTVQTFRLDDYENYRFSRENGGGVFLDEASYWLRLLQLLDLLPLKQIQNEFELSSDGGVDTTCRINAQAKGNIKTEALFSYDMPYEATHYLMFTEGKIRIRNFLAPSLGNFRVKIEMIHREPERQEVILFDAENYFLNQLGFFTQVILGKKENITPENSFERVNIMADIYNQVDG